jgi:hypothetical protein
MLTNARPSTLADSSKASQICPYYIARSGAGLAPMKFWNDFATVRSRVMRFMRSTVTSLAANICFYAGKADYALYAAQSTTSTR